jgi:hypothetical protein
LEWSKKESKNILGEDQGAFRKSHRLEDHLFTLQGISSLYKSSKKPLYLAFLDLSKAFDRVWREDLFALLWESGIQGKSWRLIKEIYKNVENKVVFGDFESDWFEQEYGVKQGCVLHPTLFSVLMNDLVNMLRQSNIGNANRPSLQTRSKAYESSKKAKYKGFFRGFIQGRNIL